MKKAKKPRTYRKPGRFYKKRSLTGVFQVGAVRAQQAIQVCQGQIAFEVNVMKVFCPAHTQT